jgi:hypothetical protein
MITLTVTDTRTGRDNSPRYIEAADDCTASKFAADNRETYQMGTAVFFVADKNGKTLADDAKLKDGQAITIK